MAIDRLVHGHALFSREHLPAARPLLEQLAEGQDPLAVVICCSDSRVIPEWITASGPGSLFVVRNVGNLVPLPDEGHASVGAGVDYAITHLGVQALIVLGHDGCGAMKAVRAAERAGTVHEGVLGDWLSYAHASWDEAAARGAGDDDAGLKLLVEENVLQQLAHALAWPVVADAVAAGKLSLHAWVYDLADGRLRFWDSGAGAFVPAEVGSTGRISAREVAANDNVPDVDP